jgi:hypothetical protein
LARTCTWTGITLARLMANANIDLRHRVCFFFSLPSLENTIVTPLSYKTLAVRPRSKFIAEKPSTASAIYLREEGHYVNFGDTSPTPVHQSTQGEYSPPFFTV